jgi:hypothetical protein
VDETPASWQALQWADPETCQWMAALEGDRSINPNTVDPYFPYMQMWSEVLHIGLPRRKGFQDGQQI